MDIVTTGALASLCVILFVSLLSAVFLLFVEALAANRMHELLERACVECGTDMSPELRRAIRAELREGME